MGSSSLLFSGAIPVSGHVYSLVCPYLLRTVPRHRARASSRLKLAGSGRSLSETLSGTDRTQAGRHGAAAAAQVQVQVQVHGPSPPSPGAESVTDDDPNLKGAEVRDSCHGLRVGRITAARPAGALAVRVTPLTRIHRPRPGPGGTVTRTVVQVPGYRRGP